MQKTTSEMENADSVNASSGDDYNEDELIAAVTERALRPGSKEKRADMRHILGFLN